MGYLAEGSVRILYRPLGRIRICLPEHPPPITIATIAVSFDDDGSLLRAAGSLGYDGLVLAGFGEGHVPAHIAPIVEEVASRLPVVFASRTGAGEVLRDTYGYEGPSPTSSDAERSLLVPSTLIEPRFSSSSCSWRVSGAISLGGPSSKPATRGDRSYPRRTALAGKVNLKLTR